MERFPFFVVPIDIAGYISADPVYTGAALFFGGEEMLNKIFLYIGAGLPFVWGISHLIPTRSVVEGFGSISQDNKRIITMEWITEAIALIALGILVLIVTLLDYGNPIAIAVYWIVIATLNALSLVSIFTGFRVHFLPYRLCPFIFTGSSIFILLGLLL
jgi:hypothetical protein